MANGNGNGWQRWALGITIGILLGGGTSTFVGKAYTDAAEARVATEIAALKADDEKDIANQLRIAVALAELKTQVEGLREDIQELKDAR